MKGIKGTVLAVLLSLLSGILIGGSQYWDDLRDAGTPRTKQSSTPSAQTPLDDTAPENLGKIDNKILENTANIEQLLSITPPNDDASDKKWTNFLWKLNHVDTGKRHSNSGSTSPLLAWYIYLASHNPKILYQHFKTPLFDTGKFNHLLQMGFLGDWYDNIEGGDRYLLESSQALLNYALQNGEDEAKEKVKGIFFRLADEPPSGPQIAISLENIRFASDIMTPEERSSIPDILLNENIKVDPRDIRRLLLIENIDSNKLIQLINKFSYTKKSMSSFLTTSALLGDKDSAMTLANDIETNANQPTNFYCSVCGLALAADGLVGKSLTETNRAGNLLVEKTQEPGIIFSRDSGSGSIGTRKE